MQISDNNYALIRAILKENVEGFISAFKSGASLESACGMPRQSSNERIQAMIDFVNAHAKCHIPQNITVTLLECNLSSYYYALLSGYEQKELEKFIENRKEKHKKLKPYKPSPF